MMFSDRPCSAREMPANQKGMEKRFTNTKLHSLAVFMSSENPCSEVF